MEELPKNAEFIIDDSKAEKILTLRHVKTNKQKKQHKTKKKIIITWFLSCGQ